MLEKDITDNLSPAEFITYMFEHTDEEGIVYIPGWYSLNEEAHSLKCHIEWSLTDCEKAQSEFTRLYKSIKNIAEKLDSLTLDESENLKILEKADFEVWQKYIRKFNATGCDIEKINSISERLDIISEVKAISKKISNNGNISKDEIEYMKKFIDTAISDSELKYYQKYVDSIYLEATKRLTGFCAYQVIIRAMRLCKLIHINAPKLVIENEAKTLASALVLNKYGISKEMVDEDIQLSVYAFDELDDNTLDQLYKRQKTNTRKSMAPLFIYLVLKEYSSPQKPLKQQEIINILKKYPYEIFIERKAVSRIIHNLVDSDLNIYSNAKIGTWFDK